MSTTAARHTRNSSQRESSSSRSRRTDRMESRRSCGTTPGTGSCSSSPAPSLPATLKGSARSDASPGSGGRRSERNGRGNRRGDGPAKEPEALAALVAEDCVRDERAGIGLVLDPLTACGALVRERALGVEVALRPERLDRRVPLVVRPGATSLQYLARQLAGRGVGDERLAAVDPLGGHRRDVDIAAELAHEG